jgi:hypothetical protein
METNNPRERVSTSGGCVESAGNDLLSPGKDYHRPQVLIVRVRDGNASVHLGEITGKLPDISVTTWGVRSVGLSGTGQENEQCGQALDC